MRLAQLTGSTLIAFGLLGCASHKKAGPPPAPPASESRIMEIRQDYQRAYPNVQIGVVVAVEKADRLAAIGNIMLDKIRENDVVTFIDSNEKPFANGVVIRKTADNVHVRYTPASDGGRDPVDGDLAVKF